MRSRALSSALADAGVAAVSPHRRYNDVEEQSSQSRTTTATTRDVESDDDDSSSEGDMSHHQDTMSLSLDSVSHTTRPASASSSTLPTKSPESAPPASTSFLRERSHGDILTDSDDDDDDEREHNSNPAVVTRSLEAAGLDSSRFNSPALARRRYPSTSVNAVSTGNTAAAMTDTTSRRISNRSRRTSTSMSHHQQQQQQHSRSFPTMFDVKGKGAARDDSTSEHCSADSQQDNVDVENVENGFASVPYDYDRLRQGAPRTAPLLPHQNTPTNRRSVSHSHPSRRYTTAFDPFINSNMSSHNTGESPDITNRARIVKKKRSYTIAATGGGGSGRSSGKSREQSGSSSPDLIRGGMTAHPAISQRDISVNTSANKRRSAHLPRSASDFISSSTSPSTSIVNISIEPIRSRKANSGSTSPVYPRSQSSGNILNTGRHDAMISVSTSAPHSNTLSLEQDLQERVLRKKLSGLQMRNRSKSRISPVRNTFQNITPSPFPSARENSSQPLTTTTRKRAKSSLYPIHDANKTFLNGVTETAAGLTNRSVSSQHFKRWSAIDDFDNNPRYDPSSMKDDVEQEPINKQKRMYLDEPGETIYSSQQDDIADSTAPVRKSVLKSGSQPISIAAMLSEEGQPGAQATSQRDQGPSLQELLGQVDLKSALSLVREAAGHSGDTSTFPSSGVRSSIDAASTFRSNSPAKSTARSVPSSRASAASPATNDSRMTGTPLLTEGGKTPKTKQGDVIEAQGRLQPSTSIQVVPSSFESGGNPDKKRKRLSMRRIFGHHGTTHSRASSHDTSNGRTSSSISFGNSSLVQDITTGDSHDSSVDVLEETRNRVDSTMKKYISSVKSELEIRYLPIYTALAMGQDPPNPLAVARYLSSTQEENNRRSFSTYNLAPDSPSHRNIEDARRSRRSYGGGARSGQQVSLADRIRKKGHKRSVWEVYPRDIAAFTMSSKSPDRYEPYDDDDDGHRSDLLEALSRERHANQRHASSELSLGSLTSIKENKALNAFKSDNSRHRHHLSMSRSIRQDGGRYASPLSPTRSRSGQSDISSYIASDDALAAGHHSSTFGKSTNSDSVVGPGWTSDGHIQSSPEYNRFKSLPPNDNHSSGINHKSSLSWSSKGFRMLRADPHFSSSSILRNSGRSSQDELMSSSKSLSRLDQHGRASDGGDHVHNPSSRPGLHRSAASDVEARNVNSVAPRFNYNRPAISRSTSKASSLAGFSKMLAGRKSIRTFGRDDGNRSNTDTEEYLSNRGAQEARGAISLSRSENTSRQSNAARIDEGENLEEAREESIFGHVEWQVQEIDVEDDAIERAEKFLHDLKASLSKAEALERRAPPKMQTYVQKYFDYDAQRRQKGQLALVQLPPPPMLCRHFRSAHTQNSSNAAEQSHVADLKDRHLEDMRKMLSHIDAPLCSRRSSHSSLQDDEKRTPLLEKVTSELDDATETLEEAIKRSQKILKQQDSAKNKITETVEMANSVETLMGGEIFQQLRMLEDHLMRLTYNATDTRGYADAAWAVLSYILRIFFWFSWIGVTILRLIKATVMLPFTVVVTILRWIFL